jgi:UDP-N-acetylglucosamine 2-epimerase (non-hydrolysing)
MGAAPNHPTTWLIGGTRPEAIKQAPLAAALVRQRLIRPVIVSTGQHPTMFRQGLGPFGLTPDVELTPRRRVGDQAELVAQLTEQLDRELQRDPPSAVVVQGDTATALVGALTAFWRQIPVVHLEAGLRSHNLAAPFPEEAYRRMVDHIAALHLAPTPRAADNLRAEGIASERIEVIGNTVVDAVLAIAGRTRRASTHVLQAVEDEVAAGRRLVLVTVHRRESWGEPLRSVLHAVRDVLESHHDVIVVLPAHPNPTVRTDVVEILGSEPRVRITEPLDYPDVVRLLQHSTLALSDSGGIQEEAPSFGVPVLVLRERTERLEAIEAGCAVLVGTDRGLIVRETGRLLGENRSSSIADGPLPNPFGDGHAAARAARAIARHLNL